MPVSNPNIAREETVKQRNKAIWATLASLRTSKNFEEIGEFETINLFEALKDMIDRPQWLALDKVREDHGLPMDCYILAEDQDGIAWALALMRLIISFPETVKSAPVPLDTVETFLAKIKDAIMKTFEEEWGELHESIWKDAVKLTPVHYRIANQQK